MVNHGLVFNCRGYVEPVAFAPQFANFILNAKYVLGVILLPVFYFGKRDEKGAADKVKKKSRLPS